MADALKAFDKIHFGKNLTSYKREVCVHLLLEYVLTIVLLNHYENETICTYWNGTAQMVFGKVGCFLPS